MEQETTSRGGAKGKTNPVSDATDTMHQKEHATMDSENTQTGTELHKPENSSGDGKTGV